MPWFKKPERKLQKADRREVPADVFEKCPRCATILYRARLAQNLNVCPSCAFHFRIPAEQYIRILLDGGELAEHDAELRSADPRGSRRRRRSAGAVTPSSPARAGWMAWTSTWP